MDSKDLIEPHGGLLVDRLVRDGAERERLTERAQSLARITIDERAESDLEMIAVGAFSPLRGFMNAEDYRSVVESMRLPNGLAWTVPITLAVPRAKAESLREGTQVALENAEGNLLGILDLSEKYSPDKSTEAQRVYGTTDRAHPGVAALFESGDVYLAGDIHVIERSQNDTFSDHRRDPSLTRAYFREKGWSTVVAFQTRNPIHRAHEYITKCALEIVDGLMIHPLIGKTKGDDIPADVRMRCYEVLLANYYPRERILLSVYPASMRYAGPKEAIFHAIARQNYGCTHFIVGRDHAGVGNFYGTYDAQKLFNEFNANELKIEPLKFENAFYSKTTGQMGTAKTAPGGPETQVNLSGTAVRDMLRAGTLPPEEFSRPEVAQILIEWAHGKATN